MSTIIVNRLMKIYKEKPQAFDSYIEEYQFFGEKNFRQNYSYSIERKHNLDMFTSLEATEAMVKVLKIIIKERGKQCNKKSLPLMID